MKKLEKIRKDFEDTAKSSKFDIHRKDGKYRNSRTFLLWCGYLDCAIKNGLIKGTHIDLRDE